MAQPQPLNILHRNEASSPHIIDFENEDLACLDGNIDATDGIRGQESASDDVTSSNLDSTEENTVVRSSASVGSLCIKNKAFSRESFYAQAILIYIIAVACIINLSTGTEHSHVWVSLLSASLGFILPAPKVRSQKNNTLVGVTRDMLVEER